MDTATIDAAISSLEISSTDLAPEVELGRRVLALQRAVLASIPEEQVASVLGTVLERARAGERAISFEDLALDPEGCGRLWHLALSLFADEAMLTSEEVEELKADAVAGLLGPARVWYEGGEVPLQSPLAPEMLGISTKPWLLAAAAHVAPELDKVPWDAGCCLVCGGEPDLAIVHPDGQRSLLCSRCDTVWAWRPTGCPYCNDATTPTQYHEGPERGYLVLQCFECNRVLKTVDEASVSTPLVPAAERLRATHLDPMIADLSVAP